ncbi:MAG: hypothetical protein OJF49_002669 [Ktedonobacterales bacterium]|nr:MAG: hypothetical protein OJF49_002669 [Ktedonobacterales bacterium]
MCMLKLAPVVHRIPRIVLAAHVLPIRDMATSVPTCEDAWRSGA